MVHGTVKMGRIRSFHMRYLDICRSKHYAPVPEVRAKNNNTTVLDFFGDKLKIDDWMAIIESLYNDQVLQNISIRMRKNLTQVNAVQESIDTEKRARQFKGKPLIYTKFVFTGIIEAVSKVLQCNQNITTLALEALPLDEKYSTYFSKALAANSTLQTISFCRSSIGDKGCEILCNTIKYLPHIENVYLCSCHISTVGAGHVAEMIKFQKIYRFSEGWKNSLRYREVDSNTMPGLRMIFLAKNPKIGDEGAILLSEVLKEDVWIKILDMEECGLTDVGARSVLNCLKINRSLVELNVCGNSEISSELLQRIKMELGKVPDDEKKKGCKQTVAKLKEQVQLLEEMAYTEKQLRKQAELLNEQLHEQMKFYERQIQENQKYDIPDGCVVVEKDAMDALIKERNDLKKALSALKAAKVKPAHVKKRKVRKARSEIASKKVFGTENVDKYSKSEHEMIDSNKNDDWVDKPSNNAKIFVERNIGDTHETEISRQDLVASKNLMGIEALRIFMRQKCPEERIGDCHKPSFEETARSLFLGTSQS